jgi:hypothetical protein
MSEIETGDTKQIRITPWISAKVRRRIQTVLLGTERFGIGTPLAMEEVLPLLETLLASSSKTRQAASLQGTNELNRKR